MSNLNQDKRVKEHSGGNESTETENESLTTSPFPQADPSSGPTAASSPGHGGLEGERQRIEDSIADTSIARSPAATAFTQAHSVSTTTQHNTQTNSDDTQQIRRYSAQTLADDTAGQPLLPEDDGMGALRERIHAIRDLGYTSAEQARMIHDLMTEKYNSSQVGSGGHLSPITSPSLSVRTLERAHTPNRWSGLSFDQPSLSSASTATSAPQDVSQNLTADDLKPTFYPRAETEPHVDDAEDADAEELEESCLGCAHYQRNVKLQCFDCRKWYTCRFCHDEVEDHHLNRPKTENMLCMLCGHAQPAAQYCKWCGGLAAQYYCVACKLWDNDASKSIYHCNDCGICRIGKGIGKDFFHCKTCSVCLPISIETTHRCIERSTQCDCPICGDYMFTSPETVVFMRCGHSIHQRCLSEYSKASYRCPICSKTITNMEATFRNLDRTIQSQPMPADFKDTKAIITCNDCGTKSVVKYHWLGLRCDMCESYNTTQLSVRQGDTLGSSEHDPEDEWFPASRLRSSSHDDSLLPTLAQLQIDPSSAPGAGSHPQFNISRSTNPPRQFSSYNLTRGRAVSPVISNYFGIPPDRQSQRSTSTSFFASRMNEGDDNDGERELNIWGTRFKYRYGFLSRGTDPADDNEEAEEPSESSDSDNKNDEQEDEEEDDEGIDIFGHR
ncbi:RING finger and CHY zinc finger domain-containing protein [Aspergillus mulundensis]|uniref:Putative Zn-finger protein n=1 Tax=Aspergillus mulundensis TaxID=1810919 RepID=A0A3D8RQ90_9EURO|nr:putative Zn-finger protein [Aspergillus mulundensis]RDW76219.1 putative Zn-finger protein [Aspergillus mulundensis]